MGSNLTLRGGLARGRRREDAAVQNGRTRTNPFFYGSRVFGLLQSNSGSVQCSLNLELGLAKSSVSPFAPLRRSARRRHPCSWLGGCGGMAAGSTPSAASCDLSQCVLVRLRAAERGAALRFPGRPHVAAARQRAERVPPMLHARAAGPPLPTTRVPRACGARGGSGRT